jgi:hypothetical protein
MPVDVEEDGIGPLRHQLAERGFGAPHQQRLVPELEEVVHEYIADVLLVLDDQHPHGRRV